MNEKVGVTAACARAEKPATARMVLQSTRGASASCIEYGFSRIGSLLNCESKITLIDFEPIVLELNAAHSGRIRAIAMLRAPFLR